MLSSTSNLHAPELTSSLLTNQMRGDHLYRCTHITSTLNSDLFISHTKVKIKHLWLPIRHSTFHIVVRQSIKLMGTVKYCLLFTAQICCV